MAYSATNGSHEEPTIRGLYDLYLENKSFGRRDMIGALVDAVEALQKRIDRIDESAVAEMREDVDALNRVIRKALSEPKQIDVSTKATEALYAEKTAEVLGLRKNQKPKRKPGRPSKAEIAARKTEENAHG